jgi:heptosyltransferase III
MNRPARILVYRIGSLGDTLVALPALWRIRNHYRDAEITLLCDRQADSTKVLAAELLNGSGLIDHYMTYPVATTQSGLISSTKRQLQLALQLRKKSFDSVVYLAPSERATKSVSRDQFFFRVVAGIRAVTGTIDLSGELPGHKHPIPRWPQEADLLLRRVEPLTAPAAERWDLGITADERNAAENWKKAQPSAGNRRLVAVAPGSKMPAKIWPQERFIDAVGQLIESHDIWPVVFGDRSEREIGMTCQRAWGRGWVASGELSVRLSAALLSGCDLYLGNDTGTMHLAASAGVRCVAIFCSHAPPGQWYPFGNGHAVLRKSIDCEGCHLRVCIDRNMECIRSIEVEEVVAAATSILDGRRPLAMVHVDAVQ